MNAVEMPLQPYQIAILEWASWPPEKRKLIRVFPQADNGPFSGAETPGNRVIFNLKPSSSGQNSALFPQITNPSQPVAGEEIQPGLSTE